MEPKAIKQLPSSTESEQAILGSCFLRPEIIPKVRSTLQSEHFYTQAYGMIFEALCALGKSSEPLSVAEWLASKGFLEACGGAMAIADLADCVPTSAGWFYHAGVIRDKASRRDIIASCSKAGRAAYGVEDDTSTILSELKNGIRDLSNVEGDRNTLALVNAVWNDVERRAETGERFIGVKTGFDVIDNRVYGLEPKTTIYLIARPSIGKTALAVNIADRIDGTVLYFSLESTGEAITRRRLAARSGIPLWRIRTANLDQKQYKTLVDVSNDLVASGLQVYDNPHYKTIESLVARCESAAMDEPISLIVVDHIQRMRSRKRLQNRHLELSWISEELSTLAKNLNVPILILCQLNREVEKRPSKAKYPQLFDIKESGDVEQNADQVWGLWRADKESPDCRLECLKGRDTGTWVVGLTFDANTQLFNDSVWIDTQGKPNEEHWQDK